MVKTVISGVKKSLFDSAVWSNSRSTRNNHSEKNARKSNNIRLKGRGKDPMKQNCTIKTKNKMPITPHPQPA